jgi:hypothetical protein
MGCRRCLTRLDQSVTQSASFPLVRLLSYDAIELPPAPPPRCTSRQQPERIDHLLARFLLHRRESPNLRGARRRSLRRRLRRRVRADRMRDAARSIVAYASTPRALAKTTASRRMATVIAQLLSMPSRGPFTSLSRMATSFTFRDACERESESALHVLLESIRQGQALTSQMNAIEPAGFRVFRTTVTTEPSTRNDTCPRHRIPRWKRVVESGIDLLRSQLAGGGFAARFAECGRVERQMLRQSVTRFRHHRSRHFVTFFWLISQTPILRLAESAMLSTRCPAATSGTPLAHDKLRRPFHNEMVAAE